MSPAGWGLHYHGPTSRRYNHSHAYLGLHEHGTKHEGTCAGWTGAIMLPAYCDCMALDQCWDRK